VGAEPLLVEDVPVAEAIVAALADAGVEHVLGIPGGLTGPIWRALYGHRSIRTSLVREESLGSYMAEAYGRLRGRPAVVMGQGEWIVGNAGQGFLESLLGSSPMVILTEMSDGGPLSHHGVYQGGSGDYGAWDARKALEGMTKRVMVSRHPAQAVQHVQLAVKHATTGDPGPVAVVFASTALQGDVGPGSTPRLFAAAGYLGQRPPAPDPDAVVRAVDVLARAERPVIIAGNGVRVGAAAGPLLALATALDVPLVTTAHGKGVADERDRLVGGVIGAFGWPAANDLVADSDVILAVGTKLGTMDTIDESPALIDPTRQVLIQVDVEPLNVGWTLPVTHGITADASTFLDAATKLATTLEAPTRPESAAARVHAAHERFPIQRPATPASAPFDPQDIVGVLNDCIPDSAIVTCDAGENRLFMMRWYRSKRPLGYLQPAAGGGMGHAVPAALGARLAHPETPVVAVCGDGGFGMSIHALLTAIELDLPIGVIVLNNGALGWVLHGMGERVIASKFADFNYAGIARAIGCDAVRAETLDDVGAALARLPLSAVPVVVEVPTSLNVSFKDILDPLDERRASSGGY
jgi:acetolactate synthase I/II/III large subunit